VWYDIKVYITFKENDTIISEAYHPSDEKWKSGTYYVLKPFQGGGDRSVTIDLRLKDTYDYFKGDAKIIVKIRENTKSTILYTKEQEIEILKSSSSSSSSSSSNSNDKKSINLNSDVTGGVISDTEDGTINLNPKSSDLALNNEVVYESKDRKIKKYLVYGFALFLIFLVVFLLVKN